MIHKVSISWSSFVLPDEILSDLKSISSMGVPQKFELGYVSRHDDPVIGALLDCLQGHGVSQVKDEEYRAHKGKAGYSIYHTRIWEQSDIDEAEYAMIDADRVTGIDERYISGFAEYRTVTYTSFFSHELPSGVGFYCSNNRLFCGDSTKANLSSESLISTKFLPTKIYKKVDPEDYHSPHLLDTSSPSWWQLASDRILPPMSAQIVRWRSSIGLTFPREISGPVQLKQPPFSAFQPIYLRSEWGDIPPFDIAGTFEFWAGYGYSRWLIVSRRFRQFCDDQGWALNYVPVITDATE